MGRIMTVLNPIIEFFIQSQALNLAPILSVELFNSHADKDDHVLSQNLNGAFLILLAGERHPEFSQAQAFLDELAASRKWGDWARFYLTVTQLITTELEQRCQQEPELKVKFQQAETFLAENPSDNNEIAEKIWSVLFPEGVGIRGHEDSRTDFLREKRTLTITEFSLDPIKNPAKQILFTSNVLLTTPLENAELSEFDQDFKTQLYEASQESQRFWYDHPIPIGVSAESNEILYGLKNFNQAVEVEHRRQSEKPSKVNFVLSVSVTHRRLQTLAKRYLKQVLALSDSLEHLNIFAFTEADTDALINQVLLPIIERSCPIDNADELLSNAKGKIPWNILNPHRFQSQMRKRLKEKSTNAWQGKKTVTKLSSKKLRLGI